MRLSEAALGVAIGEAVNDVREIGGENRGPKVQQYLENAAISVAAPWCAAFVQWVSDGAADFLGIPNPLNDVRREALVADYWSLAQERHWVVQPKGVRRGDLAVFRWPSGDHIGVVMDPPFQGEFQTVEGNTSPGVGTSDREREREGEGVYRKTRRVVPGQTFFVTWGP